MQPDALSSFAGLLRDPNPGMLPDGGRLSDPCVASRFAGAMDPSRLRDFDEGIGEAGHAGEFWILAFMFQPIRDTALLDFLQKKRLVREPLAEGGVVTTQYPIPWGEGENTYGISHPDFVVEGGPYDGAWEIKTSGAKPWEMLSPSTDNREQVKRRRRAIERRGITLPVDRIAILRKADHHVAGPFGVDLTDDDRARFDAEFALYHSFMQRADTIDLDLDGELRDACTCSCYAPPRTYMQQLESIVDFHLHELLSVPRSFEDMKPVEKQRKEILARVKSIMEAAAVTHAETGFYDLTISKTGALTCKAKRELSAA